MRLSRQKRGSPACPPFTKHSRRRRQERVRLSNQAAATVGRSERRRACSRRDARCKARDASGRQTPGVAVVVTAGPARGGSDRRAPCWARTALAGGVTGAVRFPSRWRTTAPHHQQSGDPPHLVRSGFLLGVQDLKPKVGDIMHASVVVLRPEALIRPLKVEAHVLLVSASPIPDER